MKLVDKSKEHENARHLMRLMLLKRKDGPLKNQYYKTIALVEHEAMRRALGGDDD